jgi:IS30 family transposase
MIKNGLKDRYSPEKIAGRLKREKKKSVSHETIYKMIYKNHKECGEYQKYLRQGKKKRKKRKAKNACKIGIPNRVGIEERPKIAEEKKEIGHWESDTMIGGNHSGVLVTIGVNLRKKT